MFKAVQPAPLTKTTAAEQMPGQAGQHLQVATGLLTVHRPCPLTPAQPGDNNFYYLLLLVSPRRQADTEPGILDTGLP